MNPDHTYAYFPLALSYVQARRYGDALAALDKAGAGGKLLVQQHVIRGYIHAITGRRAYALKELDALRRLSHEQPVSPWHFAVVHVGLGDHNRALDLLEEAYRDRAWQVRLLPIEPILDPLRSNPRFRTLAGKVLDSPGHGLRR